MSELLFDVLTLRFLYILSSFVIVCTSYKGPVSKTAQARINVFQQCLLKVACKPSTSGLSSLVIPLCSARGDSLMSPIISAG